jgi:hypothetical protein
VPEIRYVVARTGSEARRWAFHTAYSWREADRAKALAFCREPGWKLYRVSVKDEEVSGK